MTKLCVILLILLLNGSSFPQSDCTCKKAGVDEITYGSTVLWPLEEQRVKMIHGQVFIAGSTPILAVDDALVEVFTYPESVAGLKLWSAERERKQKRVAACKTGENGEFCFTGLRPGRYELRVSKQGLSVASGVIVLDLKGRQSSGGGIKVPAQSSI
jgi:hypothetical protein